MPHELVILTREPIALGVVERVVREWNPIAANAVHRMPDRSLAVVDTLGVVVLRLFTGRVLRDVDQAERALAVAPESGSVWTEATVPWSRLDAGRACAQRVARAAGGDVRERL
ncbi:hypothetical protein [Serinibacter salmoneus]|uniref:Uncharacterized protein n=1 Tax=Serinibacter salmoneus TaxID=556530 RepID=A0A2A9D426_9MICO|nr:hypothetical protein [Serinibacter salmoneus]PFG21005.1 hypothetical protein ATL40_2624 [Serinibacter salmoneus]